MTFLLDVRMCSACAAQSEVVDCQPTRGGFRRRRVCPQCGKRWRTMEVRMEDYEPVRDFLADKNNIMRMAGDLENVVHRLLALSIPPPMEP